MSSVAAIVLAAGTSSRYRAAGGAESTKLVAGHAGLPLVRHVALAALASRARPVVAVTGHADLQLRDALSGLDLQFAYNPGFASGLASSLRVGLDALPPGLSGVVVMLGDMPTVSGALVDRLIGAFLAPASSRPQAVVPNFGGQRGNPVLLGSDLFAAARRLGGDVGARRLLDRARVLDLVVDDEGVAQDVDDAEALKRLAARPRNDVSDRSKA